MTPFSFATTARRESLWYAEVTCNFQLYELRANLDSRCGLYAGIAARTIRRRQSGQRLHRAIEASEIPKREKSGGKSHEMKAKSTRPFGLVIAKI
jgi:hypothetical protein